MDQKFQTSFIPKKQSFSPGGGVMPQKPARRITSIYMTIAVVAFIASLASVAGVYFWKQYLLSAQQNYKSQLAERESQFNLDLVEQLKQINVQIDTAGQLLARHIALSRIFDIIQQMTISGVRFTSMDVSGPTDQNGGINLSLRGYGANLSAVAFQSDVLGQLSQYGLQKIVKNPILSDPVLDANGTVSFGFSAAIDPGSLSYTQSVSGPSPASLMPQ